MIPTFGYGPYDSNGPYDSSNGPYGSPYPPPPPPPPPASRTASTPTLASLLGNAQSKAANVSTTIKGSSSSPASKSSVRNSVQSIKTAIDAQNQVIAALVDRLDHVAAAQDLLPETRRSHVADVTGDGTFSRLSEELDPKFGRSFSVIA